MGKGASPLSQQRKIAAPLPTRILYDFAWARRYVRPRRVVKSFLAPLPTLLLTPSRSRTWRDDRAPRPRPGRSPVMAADVAALVGAAAAIDARRFDLVIGGRAQNCAICVGSCTDGLPCVIALFCTMKSTALTRARVAACLTILLFMIAPSCFCGRLGIRHAFARAAGPQAGRARYHVSVRYQSLSG